MKMLELTGRRLKINKSTITVLDKSGKTAGMITGVDTFYNVPDRDKFEFSHKAHKLGINRLRMNWVRMFLAEGVWYYLVDDSAFARAHEFRAVDGDNPIINMEGWKAAAEEYGAVIIHAANIQDKRDIR
jgi:hypothetical protein